MTACTNKARGAVVAALAGVLALGAVPAVALATGTADAQVDLLIADDAFTRSVVELGGDANPQEDSINGGYTVKANGDGSALDVEVTSVTPLGGKVVSADDYTVEVYKADADGEPEGEALDAVTDPGTYVYVVTPKEGTTYAGSNPATVKLVVKAATFDGVNFEVYEDGDEADTDLMFTGSALDLGVKNDKNLVEGEDYEVKIVKNKTDELDSAAAVDVVDQGTYYAYVTGLGQYAGSIGEVKFTVAPFDLGLAKVVVNDVIGSDTKPVHPDEVYIEGGTYDGTQLDAGLIDLELAADGLFDANKTYSFKVTANADEVKKGNIVNSHAGVNVDKVAKEATFEYDGKAIQDSYVFDTSKGEAFDYSKISVTGGNIEGVKGTDFKVTVRNDKGQTGYYGKLESGVAGTYLVTVEVLNGAGSQFVYEYGGSVTFTVKVTDGVVDADTSVYVKYNKTNEYVTSFEKAYDEEAIKAGDFTVEAYDEDGIKDADVTNTLSWALYDEDGKKVSANEVVDAGNYTLKVTSDSYDLTGTTEVPVTITKIDASVLDLKGSVIENWFGAEYVEMDEALSQYADLAPYYNTGVADSDKNDEAADLEGWDALTNFKGSIWQSKNLSVEKWDAEKEEWVEVDLGTKLEVGDYRLVVKGDKDLAKNFTFADDENYVTTVAFKVADEDNCIFNDVNPNDWFFNCVGVMAGNNTFDNGDSATLIKGYAGTTIFGPNDTINRADVVVILYRMAGGVDLTWVGDENQYSELIGWKTGFSDIDDAGLGNMYYARAVAWAKASGVVSGYDDGTFGPYDQITREQLATMLANYAKVVSRDDVSLVEGELDAMPDGGSVSTWAKKAVSWCLENELMGNDGSIRPSDTITRAETAAMAYNYLTKVLGWK